MENIRNCKKIIEVSGILKEDEDRLKEMLSSEFPDQEILVSYNDEELELEKSFLNGHDINTEVYRELLSNISDAVFLFNSETGFFLDANNAGLKFLAKDLVSLKKIKTSDIKLNRLEDNKKISIQSNRISNQIFKFRNTDGRSYIGKLNVFQLKGDLYISLIQDVTELYDAKAEYKEQDRIYKNLINNLPGFVYQCKNDNNWTMMFMSDACKQITGYDSEDFVNNRKISFSDIILEEYREVIWDKMQHAINTKTRFDETYPIYDKNKKVKWLRERAVGVFNENSELLHIEGFITDITEKVRYEQIQKVLFKISYSVIHAIDLGSLISEIKNELSNVIDTTNFYIALYHKEKDTFSLPFFSDQKDKMDDLPAGKTMTKYVVETKKSLLATIPLKNRLVEEGKLEFKGTLSKIWLGVPLIVEEEIIGVLAVQSYEDESAFDDSDLRLLEFVSGQVGLSIQIKRKEEELKEALKKAEEADALKSAFLANMSHEIRTPMNGILGFTQLIKEEEISVEERQHFLNIIEKSGNRMLNIINDLIDVSKVDAGLMEVLIAKVDLTEVMNYLFSFFHREVELKGIQLHLDIPKQNEKYFIETDGEKLYAILTNLIKNAIKYSENGTITYGYQEKQDQIEFFVKDTGIGIPIEKQKDVFSRFVQLNNTADPFTEGSGLGLSITKGYVQLLGGEIWFESEQHKGSQFYFTIPIKLEK